MADRTEDECGDAVDSATPFKREYEDLIRYDDEEHEDDSKVKRLMGQGDMGVGPTFENWPGYLGDSLAARVWYATMGGRTKAEAERNQRRQLEAEYPHLYLYKRQRRGKRGNTRGDVNGAEGAKGPRHMTERQFRDLYGAIAFANINGAIMNVHLVISWRILGFEDHSEATYALQRKVLTHFGSWYDSKKGPDDPHRVWVYSNECTGRVGFHTHVLLAVPERWLPAFRKWVKKRLGDLSHLRVLPKGAYKVVAPPSDPIRRQWIWFQYICKGLDPEAKTKASVGDEPTVALSDLVQFSYDSPGAMTCLKRMGVSSNIGADRRNEAGFRSWLDRGVTDVRVLYAGQEHSEWRGRFDLGGLGLRVSPFWTTEVKTGHGLI